MTRPMRADTLGLISRAFALLIELRGHAGWRTAPSVDLTIQCCQRDQSGTGARLSCRPQVDPGTRLAHWACGSAAPSRLLA